MKQKSEGIGLVVGRVQRIEEEAAKVPLLDHQVPPKTDSKTTKNAHFSIFKLVLRFEKVPSDQLQ